MRCIRYILILIFLVITSVGFANKEIVKAIESGNMDKVQMYFDAGNDVNASVKKRFSFLYYAIKSQQEDMCYLLLKEGADPNHIVKKKPPLFWALEFGNIRIARYLIEFGADINYQDRKNNTVLIKAVKDAQFLFTLRLIERGANPLLKDKRKKIAYDYMEYLDDKSVIKTYMKSILDQLKNSPTSYDYTDGPYFFWESENEGFLTYYKRFGSEKKVVQYEKTIKFNGNPIWVKGLNWDQNSYYISKNFIPTNSTIKTDGKVFAMGDIHGNLDGLIPLLINNGIIDKDRNWIFGNGHFVVLGDFFDRGTKVTETLWFLRNLQQKAQLKRGNVHVLLGNHELMTMEGDHRYLHSRYIYISQFIHKYYFELFDEKSELGLWLRSLNSMIKINDYLFSHAGISPEFAALNYTLDTINVTVRKYINGEIERTLESKINNIVKGEGPFWYRGYSNPWELAPELTEEFIDTLMNSFDIKYLVIGHNEQKQVTRTLNGRLLSIDVDMGTDGKNAQGLLIENSKMYRCYYDGRKELLEVDDE